MGKILLLLSLLLFSVAIWLWFKYRKQIGSLALKPNLAHRLYIPKKPINKQKYSGVAKLPNRVYVNDSVMISIELKPEYEISLPGKEPFKFIHLEFLQDPTEQQYLEIELQAAAFTVDGEKKQKQLLNFENPRNLSFQWNCFCPNSGTHSIALIFRGNYLSDIFMLGEIKQDIRVVRVDHLTQRQVGIIASGTTIVGCVSTVIGIINVSSV